MEGRPRFSPITTKGGRLTVCTAAKILLLCILIGIYDTSHINCKIKEAKESKFGIPKTKC